MNIIFTRYDCKGNRYYESSSYHGWKESLIKYGVKP